MSDAEPGSTTHDAPSLYERYATDHAGFVDVAAEARLLQRDFLPHIPLPSRCPRILDVGCGQGGLLLALADRGYMSLEGVDLSEEQVGVAHSNGLTSVVCADYQEVLLDSEGWDVVIATDFVEHLPKAAVLDLFAHVRRALNPGGVFIVRTPNATSPFFGNYGYGDFTHETFLNPRSFSQLCAFAAFTSSASYPCPPVAHGAKGHLRATLWKASAFLLKASLAAETGVRDTIVTQNFIGVARV